MAGEGNDMTHGCHNRSPFRESYPAQDGRDEEGHTKTVQVPHVMSKDCRYDLRVTDPACVGCKHRYEGE